MEGSRNRGREPTHAARAAEPEGAALPAERRAQGKSPVVRDYAARVKLGHALLEIGWASLAGAGAEALDIHLRNGVVIHRAIDLRVDSEIAQASTIRGKWTHSFALDQVVLIEEIPRGGRRKPAATD